MITTLICKGYQIYFHEEMVGNLFPRPVGNSNESNKNATIFGCFKEQPIVASV